MKDKLRLDIVTPYGLIFSDNVDEVTAPGSEGEFGVLPRHVPFLTTLKIGLLTYSKEDKKGYFFVNWGYAEVGPEKVIILADSAERSFDIDVQRAREAKTRAEERLEKADQYDIARATSSLERAAARIHISGKG